LIDGGFTPLFADSGSCEATMKQRFAIALAFFATFALALPGGVVPSAEAEEAVVLRMATLAPSGSSWMKVFNAWNQTLQKQTDNKVKFSFYPGGSQGDERDFVRKMRAGQMDGAAITTTGLGMLVRSVLVLAVPGIITEYDQLDRVRNELNATFEEMFEKEGYKLLGWGDVGKTRIFSKHEFHKPSDLKTLRPWAWKDDLIFTEFLKVVGANAVALGVPEVYTSLQTKIIDTVPASALAAVSLQWYTQLNYVTQSNSGIIVGATIVKKDKFDTLTEEQQKVLVDTGLRAHKALNKSIRRDDDKSYATILQRGITAVDTEPARAEWDKVAAEVRTNLTGRVYPQSLLDAVKSAAGK
jgi:TRAP-type C4-dicarboxylate transport system substrate-binding protein